MKVPPPPKKPKRDTSRAKERRVRDAIANARLGPDAHLDGDTASISLAKDEVHEELARRAAAEPAGPGAQAIVQREEVAPEKKEKRVFDEEGGRKKKKRRDEPEFRDDEIEIDDRLEKRAASVWAELVRPKKDGAKLGGPVEPGDLDYLEPEDIRRALGTPIRYAKHVMILAEAFRRATGATRAEATDYLARMFVSLGDHVFGRAAFKELGPATGILDIYPLELATHILGRWPWFLPKMGFASFAKATKLVTDTVTPIIFEYPDHLKVRGFALAGGGRPGYVFQPAVEPGKYALGIQSAGRFDVLISALERAGHTMIERFQIEVKLAPGVKPRRAKSVASIYPPRDEKKLAAWPVPPAPKMPDYAFEEARQTEEPYIPRGALAPLPVTDPNIYAAHRTPALPPVQDLEDPTARIDAAQIVKRGFAEADDEDVTRPIDEDELDDIDGPTIAELDDE